MDPRQHPEYAGGGASPPDVLYRLKYRHFLYAFVLPIDPSAAIRRRAFRDCSKVTQASFDTSDAGRGMSVSFDISFSRISARFPIAALGRFFDGTNLTLIHGSFNVGV